LKDFGYFFRGFFWRFYFCMVKYLSFRHSSFALRYFNVNGKATMWHTPCLFWFFDRAIFLAHQASFLEHWALPPMEATLWTPICKIEPNVLPYSLHESWTLGKPFIYLWSTIVGFVLHSEEISQTTMFFMPCSWYLQKARHDIVRGALMWFETVWICGVEAIDYWTIFFPWKLNKIETEKNFIGTWGCCWCCWKALDKSDLIVFISQFSELRCERYWFLSEFCCIWKSKQIAKIGFGRKIQLSPPCVRTWANCIRLH